MKLYYAQAACSLAPHIALREAKLPFELEPVNLQSKKTRGGGDFYAVNPKGSVPVLELDNGEILTEAAVIMRYVAERNPEMNLIPKHGTFERYRADEWLNYIATELHKGFGPLWHPAFPPEVKDMTKTSLGTKFDFVAKKLKGNQFLMGSTFTVADGYLFTVLNWTGFHAIDLGKWPELAQFQERVKARPAVQEALGAEGLLK